MLKVKNPAKRKITLVETLNSRLAKLKTKKLWLSLSLIFAMGCLTISSQVQAAGTIFSGNNIANSNNQPNLQAAAVISSGLNLGDGSWSWQRPLSQGNNLYAIECPTETLCFAGGAAGTLLKSKDGGNSWEGIQLNVRNTLTINEISCPSNNTCYAAGLDNGNVATQRILKTVNGGVSWTNSDFNTDSIPISGVGCPTVNLCFASGMNTNGTFALYHTSNGGNNWNFDYSVEVGNFGNVRLFRTQIACANQTLCYILGYNANNRSSNGVLFETDESSSIGFGIAAIACAGGTCYSASDESDFGIIYNLTANPPAPYQFPGTSYNLLGVSCATSTLCWGVGERGILMTNKDGGQTWQPQNSKTFNQLNNIDCPTLSKCIAVGDGGTILGTLDGGVNWNSLNTTESSQSLKLTSVSCLNSTPVTCYSVGEGGLIKKSTNGGINWTAQISGTYRLLNGISCTTVSECFAVGEEGLILKTSNGGGTWVTQTSGTQTKLNGIDCPATGVCFAVASNGIVQGDIKTSEILATTNGGATWTTQLNGKYNGFTAISCPSTSVCYVVGNTDGIWKTANGGANWTVAGTPTYVPYYSIDCPTVTVCYAGRIRVSGSSIIKTTDSGATWNEINQDSNNQTYTYGISCQNSQVCYFLGDGFGGSPISFTNDGGTTLTAQPLKLFENASFSSISCPNSNTCVITGDNQATAQTGDGTNWQTQPAVLDPNLNAVSCPATQTCFAVGNNGQIFNTTNGGLNWNSLNSGTVVKLVDISCVSTTECTVVGNRGTIIHTVNGGNQWNIQNSATPANFLSLVCPNAGTCLAGTLEGIYRTTNSGNSWVYQFNYSSSIYFPLTCATSSICYGLDPYGALLYSPDAGNSWSVSEISNMDGVYLSGLSCPAANNCFAVGSDLNRGKILKTTDNGSNWLDVYDSTDGSFGKAAINCLDINSCYVTGPLTYVQTHNGGNTPADWTPFAPGSSSLNDITCSSQTSCYGVGDYNSILRQGLSVTLAGTDTGQPGTLSYAFTNVQPGQTINLKPGGNGIINLTHLLPTLPGGVALKGQCGTDGPEVTVNGNNLTGNGLILGGNNQVTGIRITNFKGALIKSTGTGNRLVCVVAGH